MAKEYSGLTLLRASVARLSITTEKSSNGSCTGEVKSRNAKPMFFFLSTCINDTFELGIPF